jgi:hypothetical protein
VREAFDDGVRSQDRPPGVGRGGARRRAYRETQGEPAVPPARAIAPYVVPAGAVLVLSFGNLNRTLQFRIVIIRIARTAMIRIKILELFAIQQQALYPLVLMRCPGSKNKCECVPSRAERYLLVIK